jgi:hypothetical protein
MILLTQDIPHFADALVGKTFNVFELSADIDELKRAGAVPFNYQEKYPRGQTVCITDTVFDECPRQALAVVGLINTMNAGKPSIDKTWRLYARPGVQDWLYKLADTHRDEHRQGDRSYVV